MKRLLSSWMISFQAIFSTAILLVETYPRGTRVARMSNEAGCCPRMVARILTSQVQYNDLHDKCSRGIGLAEETAVLVAIGGLVSCTDYLDQEARVTVA